MSLTSDEVNYLVFRYLLESGFIHSSFAFQQESAVHKVNDIKGSAVRPGALINVLQKGLLYMEIEHHLKDDGSERKCNVPFTLTGKHECDYIDVPTAPDDDSDPRLAFRKPPPAFTPSSISTTNANSSSSNTISSNKKSSATAASTNSSNNTSVSIYSSNNNNNTTTTNHNNISTNSTNDSSENMAANKKKQQAKRQRKESGMSDTAVFKDDPMLDIESTNNTVNHSNNISTNASISPNVPKDQSSLVEKTANESFITLEGHKASISCGSVHPSQPTTFLTGSLDGSVRIWSLSSNNEESPKWKTLMTSLFEENNSERNADHPQQQVTFVSWDPTGKFFVAGFNTGHLRLYSYQPTSLLFTTHRHEDAITCIAWNKRGDVFVTGSKDSTVIAWDARTCEARQVFEYHSDAITALAWQDNITFATGSIDRDVFICQMGSPIPLKQCEGHLDSIRCLSWDSRGEMLISAGDEGDMRMWKLDEPESVYVYKSHKSGVRRVEWAPETTSSTTGTTNEDLSTNGNSGSRCFLSCSLDGTVKIWNTTSTTPLYSLVLPVNCPLLSGLYTFDYKMWLIAHIKFG